jgi:histidine ammonia-lyase
MRSNIKHFGFTETEILSSMLEDKYETGKINTPNEGIVTLDGTSLTIEDVVNVSRHNWKVEISQSSLEKIQENFQKKNEMIEKGCIIYGVNTGFGSLSKNVISSEQCSLLSRNILKSHAIAVGKPLKKSWVKAGMNKILKK